MNLVHNGDHIPHAAEEIASMTYATTPVSACRHCQFYSPQGRRGGHCRKLNVLVKSQWEACSLATPPFAAAWEQVETLTSWQPKPLRAEDVSLVVESVRVTEVRPTVQSVSVSVPVMSNMGSSPWI